MPLVIYVAYMYLSNKLWSSASFEFVVIGGTVDCHNNFGIRKTHFFGDDVSSAVDHFEQCLQDPLLLTWFNFSPSMLE